jgi:hypothetical protein
MDLAHNPPRRGWDLRTSLQAGMFGLAILGAGAAGVGSYIATSIRLAEYDLRLTTLEHGREEDRKATQDYQTEMRNSVARALDLLTDVRLQMARQHGK